MKISESAGGVVLNEKNEVVVVNQNGNSWSLPKGHIDPGEDALQTARREIKEETGLADLEFAEDLGSYERFRIALTGGDDETEQKRIHMFLFKVNDQPLAPEDPDNPEARWIPIEQVAELLTHAKDKEFFLGVKDKLR